MTSNVECARYQMSREGLRPRVIFKAPKLKNHPHQMTHHAIAVMPRLSCSFLSSATTTTATGDADSGFGQWRPLHSPKAFPRRAHPYPATQRSSRAISNPAACFTPRAKLLPIATAPALALDAHADVSPDANCDGGDIHSAAALEAESLQQNMMDMFLQLDASLEDDERKAFDASLAGTGTCYSHVRLRVLRFKTVQNLQHYSSPVMKQAGHSLSHRRGSTHFVLSMFKAEEE